MAHLLETWAKVFVKVSLRRFEIRSLRLCGLGSRACDLMMCTLIHKHSRGRKRGGGLQGERGTHAHSQKHVKRLGSFLYTSAPADLVGGGVPCEANFAASQAVPCRQQARMPACMHAQTPTRTDTNTIRCKHAETSESYAHAHACMQAVKRLCGGVYVTGRTHLCAANGNELDRFSEWFYGLMFESLFVQCNSDVLSKETLSKETLRPSWTFPCPP